MVVKQASRMTCRCGAPIKFPEGEVKVKCGCGTNWECGSEGFWAIKNIGIDIAPILPKPKGKKSNHYNNYTKRRSKGYGVGNGRRTQV